jgi:hypothetical protein
VLSRTDLTDAYRRTILLLCPLIDVPFGHMAIPDSAALKFDKRFFGRHPTPERDLVALV